MDEDRLAAVEARLARLEVAVEGLAAALNERPRRPGTHPLLAIRELYRHLDRVDADFANVLDELHRPPASPPARNPGTPGPPSST